MISAVVEADGVLGSMRALRDGFGGSAVTTVLLAAAQVVRNAAIPKAPVKTGTLRRSVRTELVDGGDVAVGTDLPYARRIELGFIGTDSRGRHYHQAAQPYLRPAYDETKAEQAREAIAAGQDLLRRAGVK